MYAKTATTASGTAGVALLGIKSIWWAVGIFVLLMAAAAAKKLIPTRTR
jgi:hypothetical protein